MEKRWKTNREKPELLIPAKDLEVLRTAVNFGADAVYIGGEAGDPASPDGRRGCGLFKKMRPSEVSTYFSSYTCEACVDALASGMSER